MSLLSPGADSCKTADFKFHCITGVCKLLVHFNICLDILKVSIPVLILMFVLSGSDYKVKVHCFPRLYQSSDISQPIRVLTVSLSGGDTWRLLHSFQCCKTAEFVLRPFHLLPLLLSQFNYLRTFTAWPRGRFSPFVVDVLSSPPSATGIERAGDFWSRNELLNLQN